MSACQECKGNLHFKRLAQQANARRKPPGNFGNDSSAHIERTRSVPVHKTRQSHTERSTHPPNSSRFYALSRSDVYMVLMSETGMTRKMIQATKQDSRRRRRTIFEETTIEDQE